jgi:ABC-type glutathione transport system ATPase component
VESQSGTITFNGERIDTLPDSKLQPLRRDIQFIFQDPYALLDPRQTVGYSIMEPLRVHGLLTKKMPSGACLAAGTRRAEAGTCLALSPRVFRRPAAAYLHCPRAGAEPESGDCR